MNGMVSVGDKREWREKHQTSQGTGINAASACVETAAHTSMRGDPLGSNGRSSLFLSDCEVTC